VRGPVSTTRAAPPRTERHPLRTAAAVLLWFALVPAAVATALRWVDLAGPVVPVALQSLRWAVGGVVVVLLVLALADRQRLATVVAAVLVAVHVAVAVPAFSGDPATASDDDLVVMAANLELGRGDLQAVAAAVDALDVDVLVLVELTSAAADALDPAGLDVLPERVLLDGPGPQGSAVLSRYPLVERPVGSSRFAQPAATVRTPTGEVLVRAAHPTPPVRFPALWHTEIEDLTSWSRGAVADGTPVVLAGDLNASSDHPVFRRLTGVLDDAHAEVGAGWVRTWPVGYPFPPFVQLDHVLAHGLPVVDAGAVVVPGTDHRAVWARLGPP
jgi:endonuclease/exonuclease/phosphatase (EEP) superfamily protein YafD